MTDVRCAFVESTDDGGGTVSGIVNSADGLADAPVTKVEVNNVARRMDRSGRFMRRFVFLSV